MYVRTYVCTYVRTYRQTDRQAGRQASRQAGRHAGRQTDRHHTHTHTSICNLHIFTYIKTTHMGTCACIHLHTPRYVAFSYLIYTHLHAHMHVLYMIVISCFWVFQPFNIQLTVDLYRGASADQRLQEFSQGDPSRIQVYSTLCMISVLCCNSTYMYLLLKIVH